MLLIRDLPLERDAIERAASKKLDNTLFSFFGEELGGSRGDVPRRQRKKSQGALSHRIGEHLLYCNPIIADDKLLPDGTDDLHNPILLPNGIDDLPSPFVRRMWAGGALRVDKSHYFGGETGWALGKHILCHERIKDVQLRGQGQKEKILVTVERKFARYDPVFRAVQDAQHTSSLNVALKEQMRNWNQAMLIEYRNLVFMHERSPEELEDIKAGRIAPTRYLPCS